MLSVRVYHGRCVGVTELEKAAPAGMRWVTVKDPSHPAFGLPVLVQDRRGGGSTILAGGGRGTQHLRLAGKEKVELTPEQKAAQQKYQKDLQHNRKIRQAVNAQREIADQQIAEYLGLERELAPEIKQRWYDEYQTKAVEEGRDAEWAERQAREKINTLDRLRQKAFTEARRQVEDQARAVLTSQNPEATLQELAEETRVTSLPGARVVVPDFQERTSDMTEEELADFLAGKTTITRKEPTEKKPTEEATAEGEKPEGEAAAAEEAADQEPLVPKTRQVYHRIESQDEAAEVLNMVKARRESARELKRELVQLPDAPDPGGTATLERFEVELAQASEESVEDMRRRLLESKRKRVETALAQALVTSVDRQWDTSAWKGYNIHKATALGATDALTGISSKFLGYSFLDRRVVEGLGIQGSSQIVANRMIDSMEKEELKDALERLVEFHDEACPAIAEEALKRAASLRRQNDMLQAQREASFVNDDGEVERAALIDEVTCARLQSQNLKRMLQHLGTAAASLETSATVIHVLRDYLNNGKKLVTIDMRFVPDDKEPGRTKAEGAAKRIGLRSGQYKISEHDDGSATLSTAERNVHRYLREFATKAERQQGLEQVAAETVNLDENYMPPGFRETVDGKPYHLREQQRSALEFALRRLRPDGGGALIGLGVGGGKTHVGFGWASELLQRGLTRRVLYITPDTALQGQVLAEAEKFTTIETEDVRGGSRQTEKQIADRYGAADAGGKVGVVSMFNIGRDIDRLREMGIKPETFFRALGFDAVVVDEAHRLTNMSGGGQLGRRIRDLKLSYRLGMTGTPLRKNVTETLDVVKWTNPGEFPSRAALKRQYGDLGIGTNAWHDAVEQDVMRLIEPYVWSEGTRIKAKAHRNNVWMTASNAQKSQMAALEQERVKQRNAARAELGTTDRGALMDRYKEIDRWRDQQMYRVLHDGDRWQDNAEFTQLRDQIDRIRSENPNAHFIFFANGTAGNAALNTAEHMINDNGWGEAVRLATSDLNGASVSKAKINRNKERFQTDEGVRFALASDANALGHNLQRGDVIVHLDLAGTAALEGQRNGRSLRVGREDDVTLLRMAYEDQVMDLQQMADLEVYERRLRAVGMTPTGEEHTFRMAGEQV